MPVISARLPMMTDVLCAKVAELYTDSGAHSCGVGRLKATEHRTRSVRIGNDNAIATEVVGHDGEDRVEHS